MVDDFRMEYPGPGPSNDENILQTPARSSLADFFSSYKDDDEAGTPHSLDQSLAKFFSSFNPNNSKISDIPFPA